MTAKILFVSSFPPRECGIATFTKDLSDSIVRKFGNNVSRAIVAVNESQSSLYKYGRNVKLTINEQNIESFETAARKVNKMKSVKIVNIQHEFGLFGGEYGSHLLRFMELLTKKIVTTFHTVLEKPDEKRLHVVREIFRLSDSVIVMTQTAKKILANDYLVDANKIEVIPHGVPSMEFLRSAKNRKKYGIREKNVLLTFGLLSRGKAVEKMVAALPDIVKTHPDTAYLVVGETHPRVREHEGESYRQELKALAENNGVLKNLKFVDRFLTQKEISECLRMADIYIAPSLDPKQICSGTVSYAMGAGKAIVSSKSKYNMEMLSNGRGIMLGSNEPKKFAKAVVSLLENPHRAAELAKNAYEFSRKMAWPNVATKYFSTFSDLEPLGNTSFCRLPRINFKHFYDMTDDFGMIQFAHYNSPDIESGYTLDDNARALAVSAKAYELFGAEKMLRFADRFIGFMEKCQLDDGRFHNCLDGNREFIDDVGSEDSIGRAVWALGITLSSPLPESYRLRAKKMLTRTVMGKSALSSPRAQADALIGIMNSRDYMADWNISKLEGGIIDSLIEKYNEVSDGTWKWFENYLTYGNSRIPEALFDAQALDKSGAAGKIAKESIDFLTRTLFIDGKLVPIGQEKWYMKGKERSMFDQQPIEAAGMTSAYLKAFEKTHDETYKLKARESFDWFLGKNSHSQMVYDEASGGCFDGLTQNGVNANQGAESTVSYLLARMMIT